MGVLEEGDPINDDIIILKGVTKLLIDNELRTVSFTQFLPGVKRHSLIPFRTSTIASYAIGNDLEMYYRKGYLRIVYGIDIDGMGESEIGEGRYEGNNVITFPLNINTLYGGNPDEDKGDNNQNG